MHLVKAGISCKIKITQCKLSKRGFLGGLVADDLGTIENGAHSLLIVDVENDYYAPRRSRWRSEAWVIWEDTVRYLTQGGFSHVPGANSPGRASHTQHAIWSVSFWDRLLPYSLEKKLSLPSLSDPPISFKLNGTCDQPLNYLLKI